MAERSSDRRLADITSPLWFAVSMVVFVALGITLKSRILNWIYGPLFPVFFLYVIPTAVRRLSSLPHGRFTARRRRWS